MLMMSLPKRRRSTCGEALHIGVGVYSLNACSYPEAHWSCRRVLEDTKLMHKQRERRAVSTDSITVHEHKLQADDWCTDYWGACRGLMQRDC